jgi:hypothetical protein
MKWALSRTTAGEFLAKLESDPGWVKQRNERERAHLEKAVRLHEAENPLVIALQGLGMDVSSIWDLVNARESYPMAVPVLLEHMDRNYPPEIREGIARALAIREAVTGWQKIKTAFLNDPNPTTDISPSKWAWGLALGASADDSVIEELIEMARDISHGQDRSPLIGALLRSKDPRAKQVLKELENDPIIGKDAKMARKKGHWPWSK